LVAAQVGVRFLNTRRARLLILGTAVLLLGAIYVLLLMNSTRVPAGGSTFEPARPPFPSHDVALVPSA
jgi:hypothetical protein